MGFIVIADWGRQQSLTDATEASDSSDWYVREGAEGAMTLHLRCLGDAEMEENSVYPNSSFRKGSQKRSFLCGTVQLYNRQEVCGALGLGGNSRAVWSDSALVLRAYEKWKERCPHYLRGNFHFALWDAEEQQLFCVTDHLGVKSCYYFFDPDNGFVIADTITSVRSVCAARCHINTSFIIDYLTSTFSAPDATAFQQIHLLPAAHSMVVKRGKSRLAKYWEFTDCSAGAHTRKDYAAELQHLLRLAVRERIEGKDDIGVLLSGGLDSSSIACLVTEDYTQRGIDPGKVMSVSRTFAEQYQDVYRNDHPYAQHIIDHTGISSRVCDRETLSPLEHLRDFFNDNNHPQCSPFRANGNPLMELVASQQIKTLLTGFGGDELVSASGENALPQLLLQGHPLKCLSLYRKYQKNYNQRYLRFLRAAILSPLLPRTWLKSYRAWKNPEKSGLEGLTFLRPEIEKGEMEKRREAMRIGADFPLATVARIRHQLFCNRFQFLLADYDYNSRKYGCEILHPLLDKRLVEFYSSVPAEELLKDGWQRSLFRRSMQGIVPERVRWRKTKSFFNIPYINYIRNGKAVFEELFCKTDSQAWELMDMHQVQTHLQLVLTSPEKVYNVEYLCRALGQVANMAAFIQWLEDA